MTTTNSKSVKQALHAHILDAFTKDAGWDDDNAVANLKQQLKSFDYLPTAYQRGRELVMGGTFLIYYKDVVAFLNGLGINPDLKEYTEAKSWDLYVHIMAREIARLVSDETA